MNMPKIAVFSITIACALAISWAAARPVLADSSLLKGGNDCLCDMATRKVNCGDQLGGTCNQTYTACDFNSKGLMECTVGGGGAPHNCISSAYCINVYNDSCS